MSQPKYKSHTQIMRAEIKTDIYSGENCDEHRPYWNVYAEGDMQDDDSNEPLTLDAKNFPPGTRVIVEVPVCPVCGMDVELCQSDPECKFDWKAWVEEKYG